MSVFSSFNQTTAGFDPGRNIGDIAGIYSDANGKYSSLAGAQTNTNINTLDEDTNPATLVELPIYRQRDGSHKELTAQYVFEIRYGLLNPKYKASTGKPMGKNSNWAKRNNGALELRHITHLPGINRHLALKTKEYAENNGGRNCPLDYVKYSFFPVGVCSTPSDEFDNYGQSVDVRNVYVQGNERAHNLWGDKVPEDARLYFLLKAVPLVNPRLNYYLSATGGVSTVEFKDNLPDYVWQLIPHYTVDSHAPYYYDYTDKINGQEITGCYYFIGRVNDQVKMYEPGMLMDPDVTYDITNIQRVPTIEIMTNCVQTII